MTALGVVAENASSVSFVEWPGMAYWNAPTKRKQWAFVIQEGSATSSESTLAHGRDLNQNYYEWLKEKGGSGLDRFRCAEGARGRPGHTRRIRSFHDMQWLTNLTFSKATTHVATPLARETLRHDATTHEFPQNVGRVNISINADRNDFSISHAPSITDAHDCINAVIALDRAGFPDEAIDAVFEKFNDWQHENEFASCDYAIHYLLLNLPKVEPTLLVSFLVITLASKSRLHFRSRLYLTAERIYLKIFGEKRTRDLLMGLK
jgi:hypothetical protein